MSKRIFVDMDGTIAKWQNASIEEVASKGYFLSLEPEQTLLNVLKNLTEASEIHVLSSVFTDDHSKEDKLAWLNKYANFLLKEEPIFVPYGENKSSYIDNPNEKDFLIDDFTQNLDRWHGIGVKVYNGINGTHGTWKGYSIHTNMLEEIMYKQLVGIIIFG